MFVFVYSVVTARPCGWRGEQTRVPKPIPRVSLRQGHSGAGPGEACGDNQWFLAIKKTLGCPSPNVGINTTLLGAVASWSCCFRKKLFDRLAGAEDFEVCQAGHEMSQESLAPLQAGRVVSGKSCSTAGAEDFEVCQAGHEISQESSKIVSLGAPYFQSVAT